MRCSQRHYWSSPSCHTCCSVLQLGCTIHLVVAIRPWVCRLTTAARLTGLACLSLLVLFVYRFSSCLSSCLSIASRLSLSIFACLSLLGLFVVVVSLSLSSLLSLLVYCVVLLVYLSFRRLLLCHMICLSCLSACRGWVGGWVGGCVCV